MQVQVTVPTSLLAIAQKARERRHAEAIIHEEPGAGKLHAGICRGLSGNWQSYRDLRSEEHAETIGFDLRPAPAGLPDGKLRPIPACRPDPICLKNETKADTERDRRDLISAVGVEVAEKAHRERLLRYLESTDKAHPLELAKNSLERAGASASEMDIKQLRLPLPI